MVLLPYFFPGRFHPTSLPPNNLFTEKLNHLKWDISCHKPCYILLVWLLVGGSTLQHGFSSKRFEAKFFFLVSFWQPFYHHHHHPSSIIILLMDKIRLTTKDDDYPIVYRVLTIPGGAGFLPSTSYLLYLSLFFMFCSSNDNVCMQKKLVIVFHGLFFMAGSLANFLCGVLATTWDATTWQIRLGSLEPKKISHSWWLESWAPPITNVWGYSGI